VLVTLSISAGARHAPADGFKAGDFVFAMAPVSLKIENQIVGRAGGGHYLKVLKANGDWLWVESRPLFESEVKPITGWINSADDVVSLDLRLKLGDLTIESSKSTLRDIDLALKIAGRICELPERKAYYLRAVQYYTNGIRLFPKDFWYYQSRAMCYQRLLEFQKSIADWEKLAQVDPERKPFADVGISTAWIMEDGIKKMPASERAKLQRVLETGPSP
jgi:tetratricopeptide (TPR) repeat protein